MIDIEAIDVWVGREELMLQMESQSLELLLKDVTFFQQNREMVNPRYCITLREIVHVEDECFC